VYPVAEDLYHLSAELHLEYNNHTPEKAAWLRWRDDDWDQWWPSKASESYKNELDRGAVADIAACGDDDAGTRYMIQSFTEDPDKTVIEGVRLLEGTRAFTATLHEPMRPTTDFLSDEPEEGVLVSLKPVSRIVRVRKEGGQWVVDGEYTSPNVPWTRVGWCGVQQNERETMQTILRRIRMSAMNLANTMVRLEARQDLRDDPIVRLGYSSASIRNPTSIRSLKLVALEAGGEAQDFQFVMNEAGKWTVVDSTTDPTELNLVTGKEMQRGIVFELPASRDARVCGFWWRNPLYCVNETCLFCGS